MMKPLALFLLALTFASQGWGQVQMDRIAPAQINNIVFVDGRAYPTIQSAINTAAAMTPKGVVIIPGTYTGSDTYTNASGVAGLDFRGNEIRLLSTNFGVGSPGLIASSFPHGQFPLGSDIGFRGRGPADIWLLHVNGAATNTTTSLVAGANNNILVGSTTTFATVNNLEVGRGTPNEETVASGSWAIVDSTHLNVTCAKAHTISNANNNNQASIDFEQLGVTVLQGANQIQVAPSNPASRGTNLPTPFVDSLGGTVFGFPASVTDTWPFNALMIETPLTGATNGDIYSAADLIIRGYDSTHGLRILNSGGGDNFDFINGVLTSSATWKLINGNVFTGYSDSGVTTKFALNANNGNVTGATLGATTGTVCTNGELVLSAGWGNTASVSGVVGLGQTCEWTITSNGTGQAANPTITDTLTNGLPSAGMVCDMRMVGGTGTATLIDQTTLSASAPVFTFGGTPVSASTYKVVRRCGP